MKLVAVSVYDTVAQFFSPPFFVKTVGEAERSFVDACNDHRVALSAHPEDYKLMRIGSFDDSEGVLTSELPSLIRSGYKVVPEPAQIGAAALDSNIPKG